MPTTSESVGFYPIAPDGVSSEEEAAAFTGVAIGSPVYLKGSMGDAIYVKDAEGHTTHVKSVTVEPGFQGTLIGYHLRREPYAGWWMARVNMKGSPGQQATESFLRDFCAIWTTEQPRCAMTRLELVLDGVLPQ